MNECIVLGFAAIAHGNVTHGECVRCTQSELAAGASRIVAMLTVMLANRSNDINEKGRLTKMRPQETG